MRTYSFLINPINGPNLWAKTPYDPLLPPKEKRQPGRPKTKRIKEPDEPQNPYKLRRTCLVMKCKKCGQPGHNIRSCRHEVGSNKRNTSSQVSYFIQISLDICMLVVIALNSVVVTF